MGRTADRATLTTIKETGDNGLVLGLEGLKVNDASKCSNDDSQVEETTTTEIKETRIGADQSAEPGELIAEEDQFFSRERNAVLQYLLDNVPEFRELSEIRQKARKYVPSFLFFFSFSFFTLFSHPIANSQIHTQGWDNPEGDRYFERQRHLSDHPDEQTSKIFMGMMQRVGAKMQDATSVFTLPDKRPSMLALGCAPGGFVNTALKVNPDVQIVGITLPVRDNGVECLVRNRRLVLIEADVTMLAADLGLTGKDIPADHPDAHKFLARQIRPRQQFDLVTCEGGVLRTHEVASYREHREPSRLRTSQLAIALARLRPGGSMVMLMHKAETRSSLCLFYTFSRFATVRLFKPDVQHQHRSSFYMVATGVQSQGEEARRAVRQWTSEWEAATFGSDEEYREVIRSSAVDIDQVLTEFGEKWVEMSREVWSLQIQGLQRKSFTK